MRPVRFWIREADGTLHDGINIQGSGGALQDSGRLEGILRLRLAEEGRDTGLYEPRPGFVLGYYDKWWGRAESREIDLRGAVIERVSREDLPNIPPPAEDLSLDDAAE